MHLKGGLASQDVPVTSTTLTEGTDGWARRLEPVQVGEVTPTIHCLPKACGVGMEPWTYRGTSLKDGVCLERTGKDNQEEEWERWKDSCRDCHPAFNLESLFKADLSPWS